MRAIFSLCGLILLIGGIFLWRSFHQPIVFGEFTGAPQAEIIDVIDRPQDYLNKTVALQGQIAKQCETMGCYFYFITKGGKELRVDLAQIAMNAPQGKNGHQARVEGRTAPYDKGYQFMASAVEFE